MHLFRYCSRVTVGSVLALWIGLSSAFAITLKDLEGEWVMSEAQNAGEFLSDDQLSAISLAVQGATYSVKIGDVKTRGKLKLDANVTPALLEMTEEEGPNSGRTFYAVCEKTAAGFRACYSLASSAKPTELKSTAENGFFLASYKPKPGSAPITRALRVLLISGGCCHDYPGQDKILSQGLAARANVEFTVVRDEGATGVQHKISAYQNPNWAQGYDCVIHNECYSDTKELDWLERIVKPHREGVPAVVIHCAMHCYRAPTNDWFKFVGVTSRRHGSHFDYVMTNVKAEHPIMKGMPLAWRTKKEELYNIEAIEPTTTPLATGWSHETKRGEVNVWVNTFGKARVFGTTLGHYNHTMEDPQFLDMLTRGLLWSCGKLEDSGLPAAGYGKN